LKCRDLQLLSDLIAQLGVVLICHSGSLLTKALSSSTEHTMSATSIVSHATPESQSGSSSC